MTAIEFLRRAALENARIVSTGDLHSIVISEAMANDNMFIDPETGLGFVILSWDLSICERRPLRSRGG